MNDGLNPKLIGSNIIDAIPQTGECPVNCPECFYNGGRFYRALDVPLIPTPEEAQGKIVRINSGHDSNINRELVLRVAAQYSHSFFNTSIARFDFPGPVVFTCNGHRLILAKDIPVNLMFVRFRLNTINLDEADQVVQYYWVKHGIPVVMTFMRYYHQESVPDHQSYELRRNILNNYWMIRPEIVLRVMARWRRQNPPIYGVRMCGTLYSSYCGDCRNCEFLYWDCLRRMGK